MAKIEDPVEHVNQLFEYYNQKYNGDFFSAVIVYLLVNEFRSVTISFRNWDFCVAEDGKSVLLSARRHEGRTERLNKDTLDYINNDSRQSSYIYGKREREFVVFRVKKNRN